MHAYANPENQDTLAKYSKYNATSAGYGIVRFNKKSRKITLECWPRGVDVSKPDAPQYPDWPIVINQEDNYARKAVAYLPKLEIQGMTNPVVQVIDESTGETVYTIRINGTNYRPKVFKQGMYTVIVGNQSDKFLTLKGIKALDPAVDKTQTVSIK